MSDSSAFLNAIRKQPDDHTAKVVYADWLAERGAEFEAQAEAWRWMGMKRRHPSWNPTGASYGPGGTTGINHEWYWMFGYHGWVTPADNYYLPYRLWEAGQYPDLFGLKVQSIHMTWTRDEPLFAFIKVLIAWRRLPVEERRKAWEWEP